MNVPDLWCYAAACGVMNWVVPFSKSKLAHEVPVDTFGVFATVERGAEVLHGCQGHWSLTSTLTPDELVETCKSVSHKASFEDPRNLPHLQTDVSATLTLSFMLITDESNYNPEKHGLIATTTSGESATYLPGVFGRDVQFGGVRESLVRDKLRFNGDMEEVRFVKYRTVRMSYRLVALLSPDGPVPRLLGCQALRMFAYLPALKLFDHDPSDGVRSAGILYFLANVLQCCKRAVGKDVAEGAQAWLDAWSERFYERTTESVQRDGFILRALVKCPLLTFSTEAPFRVQLEAALENPKLDPTFVRPQAVLALCDAGASQVRFNELIAHRYRRGPMPSSMDVFEIYRLNWDIQALRACMWYEDVARASEWVLRWANQHVDTFGTLEPNVLSCAFECVRNIGLSESSSSLLLLEWMLASELQRRCVIEQEAITYPFSTGGARLDVTAHVINGWLV